MSQGEVLQPPKFTPAHIRQFWEGCLQGAVAGLMQTRDNGVWSAEEIANDAADIADACVAEAKKRGQL